MDSQKQKLSDGSIVMDGPEYHFSESFMKTTDQAKYNSEEDRLKTFVTWPFDSAVDPARLAKSGFLYTGKGDEVVCFSCHGHIKDWEYGDIVQRKHMELFPNCDFVNNRSSNVPLTNNKLIIDNIKICRRFSEPTVNGVKLAANGIQKQLSVAENLLTNGTSDYLPPPNAFINVARNVKAKSHVAPSIGLTLETLFQEMKSAEKRLKTFKNGWPVPFIDVEELAGAGFFYLGSADKVQCPFCGGIVSNWEVGDKPLTEHRRHFPHCAFLSTLVSYKPNENSWYKGKGYDVCGRVEGIFSNPLRSENKLLDKSQEHTKLEDLGVSLHRGPAHPQQATLAARLRSFISWPSTVPVRKEDLAAAGFFYIGISDHTKCFHCDGGLCSWEEGDEPWVEHSRWFRNCTFVRLNKGDDFIKMCVAKHPTVQPEAEHRTADSSGIRGEDILTRTEEAMNSSLIQAVLETGLFPTYLVRAAVMRQLKETGSSFTSVDDICEAVAFLKQQMENQPPQQIEVDDDNLVSTLNIEVQSEGQMEEREAEMEISELPVLMNGCEKPVGTCGVLTNTCEKGTCSDSSVVKNISQETCNVNLEEENRFLKDQRLCKVCMDNEVGVVFLPCGHLLSCTLCAPALKICPMCRKSIQATVRAYLP